MNNTKNDLTRINNRKKKTKQNRLGDIVMTKPESFYFDDDEMNLGIFKVCHHGVVTSNVEYEIEIEIEMEIEQQK